MDVVIDPEPTARVYNDVLLIRVNDLHPSQEVVLLGHLTILVAVRLCVEDHESAWTRNGRTWLYISLKCLSRLCSRYDGETAQQAEGKLHNHPYVDLQTIRAVVLGVSEPDDAHGLTVDIQDHYILYRTCS